MLVLAPSARFSVPELGLDSQAGTLGGRVWSVGGLLSKVCGQLGGVGGLHGAGDQAQEGMQDLLAGFAAIARGERPFTLEVCDPLAASWAEPAAADDDDDDNAPQMDSSVSRALPPPPPESGPAPPAATGEAEPSGDSWGPPLEFGAGATVRVAWYEYSEQEASDLGLLPASGLGEAGGTSGDWEVGGGGADGADGAAGWGGGEGSGDFGDMDGLDAESQEALRMFANNVISQTQAVWAQVRRPRAALRAVSRGIPATPPRRLACHLARLPRARRRYGCGAVLRVGSVRPAWGCSLACGSSVLERTLRAPGAAVFLGVWRSRPLALPPSCPLMLLPSLPLSPPHARRRRCKWASEWPCSGPSGRAGGRQKGVGRGRQPRSRAASARRRRLRGVGAAQGRARRQGRGGEVKC